MASSAVMLMLGVILAITLIVFLSNARASRDNDAQAVATGAPAAAAISTSVGAVGGAVGGGVAVSATPPGGSGAPATFDPSAYADANPNNNNTLNSGVPMAEGATITSINGKYVLTYHYGYLEMTSANFSMWKSDGTIYSGGVVKITNDGNLGIFTSSYSVTPAGWSSATAGRGNGPYILRIGDDGQLVLYDSTPTVIWKATGVNMPPAGVDCVMGAWTDWTPCDKPCDGGNQTRTRTVITPANTGGKACDPTSESRACNTQSCGNCIMSNWGPWGECSAQVPDKKFRSRTITTPSGPGGMVCPGNSPAGRGSDPVFTDEEPCHNATFTAWQYPIGGELTAAPCSAATGIQAQTRTMTSPSSNGGASGDVARQGPCTVNCALPPASSYPSWSGCTSGNRTRTFPITNKSWNGGTPCPNNQVTGDTTLNCNEATMNCNQIQTCSDCVLGTTFTYGECNPTTGTMTRTRVGDIQAGNGGMACPAMSDTVTCAVNCVQTDWSGFSACNTSTGTKTRTRTTTTGPLNGGTACGPLTDTQSCDVDCQVSAWSAFTGCSLPCGGGKQNRTRTVTLVPKNNGKVCPALTESNDCNTQSCAWGKQTTNGGGWWGKDIGGGYSSGQTVQSCQDKCSARGDCFVGAIRTDTGDCFLKGKVETSDYFFNAPGQNWTFLQKPGYVLPPLPGPPVTIWVDCNYSGQSLQLGVGDYPWLPDIGFPNDTMSSIKVPAGLTVTLYVDSWYNGAFWTIRGPSDQQCFIYNGRPGGGNWNDVVSSMKVYKSS